MKKHKQVTKKHKKVSDTILYDSFCNLRNQPNNHIADQLSRKLWNVL